MEQSVNERINMIIREYDYKSVNQLANKIGVARTSLNDIVKNNAEPKYSTLLKILEAEPSISAEWLLRGEGEMKKQSSEIVSEDNIKIDINMDSKDVVIKALTEKIQRLESENAELRRKYEPSEERPSA